jgi:predicted transcriptional regulator
MYEHLLTHIEASSPCSLFGAAAWAQEQLDMTHQDFIGAIETMIAQGIVTLEQDWNEEDQSISLYLELV